jgi:hypothetical protein
MSTPAKRELLSIGVFLMVVVVSILLYMPLALLTDWTQVFQMILLMFGCWTIILAGVRASNPQKYERRPYSTFAWGLLLATIGGAWFVSIYSWIYSLMVLLLVIAALAIVSALKKR